MFSKLFSCLADSSSNHDQVDLSRQQSTGSAVPIQNKPSLPKESNINGQQIQFMDEDFKSNNLLQMHFLQQANVEARQKYYYEQDDGEVESKITTASPSKTQHYKILNNKDELPPNLILENQNNLLTNAHDQRLEQDASPIIKYSLNTQGIGQHQQAVSMTEKKLNNYLQQAKFLMNSQQTSNNNQQVPQYQPYQSDHQPIIKQASHKKSKGSTHLMKNYSYDTEVYSGSNSAFMHQQQNTVQQNQLPAHLQNIYSLDNCPSSKILFNALDDFKQEHIIVGDTNKNLKSSFSAQKNKSTQRRLQKLDEQKKSYSDSKRSILSHGSGIGAGVSRASQAKPIIQSKTTVSNKKDFYAHRNSEISRTSQTSSNIKIGNKNQLSANRNQKVKQSPNQIIDQFDNIIIEEQNIDGDNDYQQQSYDGQLRVLDYDEDNTGNIQQIDLGSITAYNKRQTSKTEVFSPLTYSSHRKNKVSAIPSSASKPLKTKQVSTGVHKKTASQIQMMASGSQTRNSVFNKKHMTTTTSPNAHERTPEQPKLRQQISLTTGKKQSLRTSITNQTQPSPQKRQLASHNTMEIQEDQNEEEDCKYELQSHKSATAKFQLQQREFDIINQTISPSSSSSFQFQPKFFKPTGNIASQQSQSKLSLSMGEDPSQIIQSHNLQNFLYRKDSQSQL